MYNAVLFPRLKELCAKRDTLKSLVVKNLKNRYAGSRLGFGWPILNALLLALVVSFVFTHIFRTGRTNFTYFILSGMLPWFFFSSSINESVTSILRNSSLLSQFSIPREIFPTVVVCSNFIIFLIGLVILVPFFVIVDLRILGTIFYLPLLLLMYFGFTLGFSYFVSSVNIIFRDLAHILNIGLMLWMWVTPIFYSLDSIPLPYSRIALLNPVVPFVYLFHALLYDNRVLMWPYFLWAFASTFLSFFIGYGIFLKLEHKVVKKM